MVEGLRFSNYVNGQLREPGDPLSRTYYAVMTCVLNGWEGVAGPLPLVVESTVVADIAVVALGVAVARRRGDKRAGPDV